MLTRKKYRELKKKYREEKYRLSFMIRTVKFAERLFPRSFQKALTAFKEAEKEIKHELTLTTNKLKKEKEERRAKFWAGFGKMSKEIIVGSIVAVVGVLAALFFI